MTHFESPIPRLVDDAGVLICAGSGGVGKTTTAAALALRGAQCGRRAVVVTIDPARRLADALGLASLSDVPTEVHPGYWAGGGSAAGGELHALMLDTKSTFDRLVAQHSESDEQAARIYENRFYRNLTSALSGTQEYMAMEKLHELHTSGAFDLIVVDTPPTRHALDFLDAPGRLLRLLENRLFRVLMMPTRAAGFALRSLLRTISRVVGREVIEDVVAFFQAFEGMEEGFRERAGAVRDLIGDPSTAFVLVTTPRRDAIAEAEYFTRRLAESDLTTDALVVNRVHPSFSDRPVAELQADACQWASLAEAAEQPDRAHSAARLAELASNLAELQALAEQERSYLDGIGDSIGHDAVVFVPSLTNEITDLATLGEIADHLGGVHDRPTPVDGR